MALKAVIFDYGMVLSGPADPSCHADVLKLTGLRHEAFERLYWESAASQAYDEGRISGAEFWRQLTAAAGLRMSEEQIAELNLLDTMMWTTANSGMVSWHGQLKVAGLKTAILSNMGESIANGIQKEHAWVREFDHQFWSHAHGMTKPTAEFYLRALWKLEVKPEEALLIDDRPRNVSMAQALQLQTHLFQDLATLRVELAAREAEWGLPLPVEAA